MSDFNSSSIPPRPSHIGLQFNANPRKGRDRLGMPMVISSELKWVPFTPLKATSLSSRAFVIDRDNEKNKKSPQWVIRAQHEGALVPGRYDVNKQVGYVPSAGRELAVHEFDVLCARVLRWLPGEHGQIPEGPFPAGKTAEGDPIYVCKVYHEPSGLHLPGKVHSSYNCAYVSYDGEEIPSTNYEVLSFVYECLAKYYYEID